MTANRPQPRPGVLDIAPYVPGKSTRAGRRQGVQALLQRDAAGAEPEGDRRLSRGRPSTWRIIRTARRRDLREAIGARVRARSRRIVCGAGSDDLLNLLARAYLADGDEAIHTTHGFLVYPIATLGTGAKPVVAPEKNFTADVDAILAARDAAHQDRLPRQPEQSDRHLSAVRRGQAPARRRCRRMCCWCSTRPMPNTCSATTTSPASSWSPPADNVVMSAPSRRSTGSPRCGSAGCTGRRTWSTRSTASAGRSTSTRRRSPPASRRSRDTAHVERSREHNTRWLAWLTEEIGKLGLTVTPSVANFVLIHFPETKGRTAKDADAFLTKRGLILRQVGAYKLPNALAHDASAPRRPTGWWSRRSAEFLGKAA